MSNILLFDQKRSLDISLTGGKGANLAKLTQAGTNVPPGYILDSTAFKNFIAGSPQISSLINSNRSANEISHEVNALLSETHAPMSIARQLEQSFDNLDCQRVAVRSSATAEDSHEYSWAGILETTLNVKKMHLVETVRKCWLSAFSERAINYMRSNRYHTVPEIAVVVQCMLDAEISGVAFSTNPVSNNSEEIVIEAVLGLGEGLVSGQVTPDRYILDKKTLAITSKATAKQKQLLSFDPDSDTNLWRPVEEREMSETKLTSKQLMSLAKQTLQISQQQSYECDIEWGIVQDTIYILQSRPVTTK